MPNMQIGNANELITTSGEKVVLPFNLSSGFRGVDATKPAYSEESLRGSLFDLKAGSFSKHPVHWGEGDNQRAVFDVPSTLEFIWRSENLSVAIAGETKASFQRNLTSKVSSGSGFSLGSLFGFGGEFERTFHEEHLEETFEKYAAHYERQQIYSVRWVDDPVRALTSAAAKDLETLSAAELVNKYGTHFMSSASFGGVKIFASRIDIRDEMSAQSIRTAMSLAVSAKDPESGASGSAEEARARDNQTIQKLSQMMQVELVKTIGGHGGANREQWVSSLYVNPTVINYELKPLSDLAPDHRKGDIHEEIQRRLADTNVRCSAEVIALMVDVVPFASDGHSGAKRNLTVGWPQPIPGWFYIGQWGLPQAGPFPSGYRSLIFKNVRADGTPAIKPAERYARRWGKSSGYGLYSPVAPDGYTVVGDLYADTDDPNKVGFLQYYGCLRNDLVEDSSWLGSFWDDGGSGARDNGSAWAFENNSKEMVHEPVAHTQARMFKAFSGYWASGEPKRPTLRSSKIKVLSSQWLEPPPSIL